MSVDIAEAAEEASQSNRSRWIGVYIAVLAVLLSIATMIGQNAEQDAAKANLDATNMWAFFQAKNIRRQQFRLAADDLRFKLAELPESATALKTAIRTKIVYYDKKIAEYTSEKDTGEGLDELFVRAKELEQVRDDALERGPYFDYGEALLQIAIVMASVAIVTGGSGALILSIIIGIAGALSSANGIFMFVTVPGL